MEVILTLVAGVGKTLAPCDVEAIFKKLPCQSCDDQDWLAPQKAVDLYIPHWKGPLSLSIKGVDICVTPKGDKRRKALLMADMDSTILAGETLDYVSKGLGLGAEMNTVTQQAMEGRLDFETALKQRVYHLKGLGAATFQEAHDGMAYTQGAQTLIKTMQKFGKKCALVSGGFEQTTQRVASFLGFDFDYGNRLEIKGGLLTGKIIPPILDEECKATILRTLCSRLNIKPSDVLAVGDGANDVAMIRVAGLGVSFYGKAILEKNARGFIRYGDLETLLYYQGYRQRDFAK